MFVTNRIAETDSSRIICPHSPAPDGWASGVDQLTTRPKPAQPMVAGAKPSGVGRPVNFSFPREGHGPYVTVPYPGNLSEYVTRVMPDRGPIEMHVPNSFPYEHPVAEPSWTGVQYEGWYQSEFGCVSWPSFESISPSMSQDQWSLSSPVARTRNWNGAPLVMAMFGSTQNTSETGEKSFKRQLYQSQIAQALIIKTEVEAWRSTNNFGTTFWMFNEIWATGGWGSIEYATSSSLRLREGLYSAPFSLLLEAFTRMQSLHVALRTRIARGALVV